MGVAGFAHDSHVPSGYGVLGLFRDEGVLDRVFNMVGVVQGRDGLLQRGLE